MAVRQPKFKDLSLSFPSYVYASFCKTKTNIEIEKTPHGIVRTEVIKSVTTDDLMQVVDRNLRIYNNITIYEQGI